jgi:hypothetical protein
VVGGGAGGCGTANKFASKLGKGKVKIYSVRDTISLTNVRNMCTRVLSTKVCRLVLVADTSFRFVVG